MNTPYPAGSINNPREGHASYALKQVLPTAERILRDNTATDNERSLADCVIALNRSMLPSWTQIGAI